MRAAVIKFCSIGLLTTITLAGASWAAADNKNIIKHRHGVMEAIGGHFSAALATMAGPEQFQDNQAFHAEAIARLAKISVDTFPAGSGKGKTKAKMAIWEQPEEFAAAMDKFLVKADEFASASTSGDMKAYGAAAKALGGSCKGCHDDFKKK